VTRPRRNLLLYLAFMLVFGWLSVTLPFWAGWILTGLLVAVLVAIAVVGREFFRARVLMRQREYVAAAQALIRFQEQQRSSSARRAVAVLLAGRWTFDAVAVAENDLGAIASENGRIDVARKHFDASAALDPGYAIPHVNLALLLATSKDASGAMAEVARARALGFRVKALQRAVDAALQANSPPAP